MKQVCKYARKCGGCQYQGLSYTEQLTLKQKETEKRLKKFHEVNNITKADQIYNYRNKNQVSFSYDKKGKVHMGNYIESTHDIVDVKNCQIQDTLANRIFKVIFDLVVKMEINIFNENTLKGFLRHVLVRTTSDSKHALVVLVTGQEKYSKRDALVKRIKEEIPEIDGIYQNINNQFTSMVLGKKSILLFGEGYIIDNLLGYSFRISPSSFYQIHHKQTEKLYTTAIKMANFKGNEIVLDAYCGIGTIGICLASLVREVDAVEINKNAIKDAIDNAKRNNIKNIRFYAEDAKDFMKEKHHEKKYYDVVIVDPPRAGLDKEFLYHLQKLSPSKIIYISCNPTTQERDISYLKKCRYKVEEIQPVDMLPFTSHIESIVLLNRAGR